jgi:hypothetical protein
MLSKEFITEEPSDPDRGQTGPAPIPDWLKNAKSYLSDKLGFTKPGDRPAGTQSQADANRARVKGALPDNMSMNDYNTARDASEPEEPPTPISPTADAKSDILPPATPAVQVGAPIPATKLQATELPGVQVGTPIPTTKLQATPLPAQKSFSEPAAADPEQLGSTPDELARMQKNAGLATTNEPEQLGLTPAQIAAANAPKTVDAINPENGEKYKKLAPAPAADDEPEQLGYSTDELERIQKNAGLPKTEKAINPETGEEYNKLATAQSAAVDTAPVPASANASSSYTGTPAAPAATTAANAEAEKIKALQAQNDAGGADDEIPTAAAAAPAPVAKALVEPEPAPAAPAAPVDADTRRPGKLDTAAAAKYQPAGTPAAKPAAKSNPAVLKQQQELIAKGAKIKADGVMGPATQAAIKQFAAAPAASRSAAPAAGAGRGFVNPTAADTKAAVAAAKPATPAKPAAPVKPAVKESQEISRMRFLAGLIKDQK